MADETPSTNGSGEPPKIKLNLGATGKPKTGPKDAPMSVTARPLPGKSETTRIELAKATPPAGDTSKIDPVAVSKMSTMRVEIVEPQRKAETTRIDLAAAAPKPAPRIDVTNDGGSSDDLFKRNTIAVGVPTPPPMTRPKTIQVKRPSATPSETIITTASSAASVSEAKKSETARIDLPPDGGDRPATRPKTIRIKRPDGTSARKPLMIARPSEEAGEAAETISPLSDSIPAEAEEVGTLFSILALAALLVACVVVYVLAAQTVAPNLPFPGRLLG
jgi:hypothetical protein